MDIPFTMSAAVHTGAFQLEIENRPVPLVTDDDDVLVRVSACGICGSDKHDLETPPRRRQIPGHEFAGVVAAVGTDPGPFAVGDRVLVNPQTRCGVCDACRARPRGRCARGVVYGCRGDQPPGAFAEYCLVRTENLSPVPADVPLERIALVDPLAVAIHAVNSGPEVDGKDCVILGAGVIGLLLAQVLRLRGAGRVVLVDIAPSHLETARSLGPFETILGDDVDRTVSDLEPLRCDTWFELAGGDAPTLDVAIRASAPGGRILLISQRPAGAWINYQLVLFKQLVLQGVAMTSHASWTEATRSICDGTVAVDPLITHRFPLGRINDAVETAVRNPDSLKVLVVPTADTGP